MMIRLAMLVFAVLLGSMTLARAQTGLPDAAYLDDVASAMTRMMAAMQITPTGDADRDFVAAMVPHHRGAVEMAEAELKYGKNAALGRIAQEIIVTQRDEIVAMHRALAP